MDNWLAYPEALWLLLALPVLACLAVWAWLRRRRGWRLFGQAQPFSWRRGWRGLCLTLGLLLAGIAAAKPYWGREDTAVAGAARDMVVVLDVSRSMLAETPSRQLRAQRLLSDLAMSLKQRGGHRVALVSFAARAQLVMPLTADYDLFQTAILEQDAARLPEELRPGKEGAASGTRLGQALQQAVAAHDSNPEYRGSQIVLLLSDGDDPLDDGEWKAGVAAARRASIPVFVVGIGNAREPSRIRVGDNVMTFDDEPVETMLNEALLKEIAERGDGAYLPVHTQNVTPGTLFPTILEAASARPRDAAPVEDFHQRFRWFLIPAMLLLGASMLILDRRIVPRLRRWTGEGERWAVDEGPGMVDSGRGMVDGGRWTVDGKNKQRIGKLKSKVVAAVGLAFMSMLLIAAAPVMDEFLRRGNEAFQRKDYSAALELYELAEERAEDPGLVAFNKAAALSRLGRAREAELSYLRCLQDQAAPAQRRLKALYDLGLLLLQRGTQTKDLESLVRAGDCFELCRKGAGDDASLRDDAEHNLELARWIHQRVYAELKIAGEKGPGHRDPPGGGKSNPFKDDFGTGDPQGKDPGTTIDDPGQASKTITEPYEVSRAGSVQTLPNTDELQKLDPDDAREILAQAIRRIERERAQTLGPMILDLRNVKDW